MRRYLLRFTAAFATVACAAIGAMAQTNKMEMYFEKDKVGLKDSNGNVVVPALYFNIVPTFYDGLALAGLKNGKWGYVDEAGKEAIPFIYEDAANFAGGLAPVKLNGKFGMIDTSGNEVIPFIYDMAGNFADDRASVKLNGKWGAIDTSGNDVIPLIYDEVIVFADGMASAKLNGKCGMIETSGKEVVPFIYESVGTFHNGYAYAKSDGKWGFVDRTGREVVPAKYDNVDRFSNGLAPVCLNKKWGFVDETGKEALPFIYDAASPFSNGEAKVVEKRVVKLIDTTGRVTFTLPKKFNTMDEEFTDGVAIVSFRGKMHTTSTPGLRIDNSGIQYYSIATYINAYITDIGMAATAGESISQSLIDRTGREIIPYKTGRIIKRHTDGTFELFKRSFNGKKIVSTGKFYDKEGNKIEGREKTKW